MRIAAAARASVSRPPQDAGAEALLLPLGEGVSVSEINLLEQGASAAVGVLHPQFHTSLH